MGEKDSVFNKWLGKLDMQQNETGTLSYTPTKLIQNGLKI